MIAGGTIQLVIFRREDVSENISQADQSLLTESAR
jgi:hypothetical protein